jgi:hypothetical protein
LRKARFIKVIELMLAQVFPLVKRLEKALSIAEICFVTPYLE